MHGAIPPLPYKVFVVWCLIKHSVVNVKSTVFWDVTPSGLVDRYRRFGEEL
jgi:hypothetical protein